MLGRQKRLIRRELSVQFERSFQGPRESLDRHVAIRFGFMRARSVPAIDRAVGVQKERRERLVVIVLEQRKIESIGLHDPHADELIEELRDDGIAVDDPRVELCAGFAGNASNRHQQGLAGFLRFGDPPRQIVVDPEAGLFHRLPVAADLFFAVLGGRACGRREDHCEQNQAENFMHGSLPLACRN